MKTTVTNRLLPLIVFFVISTGLFGSFNSFAFANFVRDIDSIDSYGKKFNISVVFNEINILDNDINLPFNSIRNNLETEPNEVLEVAANNLVQLVAESFLGYEFSYWSVDDVKMSENIVFEFLMPEKDVIVSAHYVQVIPPTIQIISPIENIVYLTSDIIEINIEANSSLGQVEKVELYLDENLVFTFFETPYKHDLENYIEGKYTLKAIATDNTGQISISNITNFSIEKPNEAPTVSITAPSENAQFTEGDNINISTIADDSDGMVIKVDFYNGTALLGTNTSFPFNLEWTNLPVGSFSLTAKATDNEGTTTFSSPVNINVIEKVTEDNLIDVIISEPIIVTPVNNQEYDWGATVQILVMFQGSDESVRKVEYYSGNEIIGSSVISPFAFTWQNPASGKHILTAKAIGSDQSNFKISGPVGILVKEKIQIIFQIKNPIRDSEFYQGSKINISVEIPESNNPISKVEYFRGNVRIGTSTSAPYDYTWNNAQKGIHNLVAQLTYVNGTKILSNPVPIKVLRRNHYTVKLTSQNNEREVISGENLDLFVELLELENKVEFVEYILDGEKLGSSEKHPYGFQWKNISEGNHELIAHAVDASGLSYFSAPVIIVVKKDIRDFRLEYVIGPNPTTEYLNVIFTNLDGIYDFEFRVISMNGMVQKTFKARPEDSTVTIDVSDLRSGVYVLQITANGNEISSKKFMRK